jgi:putative transposase
MAEYRHTARATFDLKYHVIWITKLRYKILRGRIAEHARDLIRQVCQAGEAVMIRGAVSPDHIHMLLWAPPHLAPAKLVQYIKGGSSRKLQEEFPELRKRYWGPHLWARGYFLRDRGRGGRANDPGVQLKTKKWDEDDQGFKITAPTEP